MSADIVKFPSPPREPMELPLQWKFGHVRMHLDRAKEALAGASLDRRKAFPKTMEYHLKKATDLLQDCEAAANRQSDMTLCNAMLGAVTAFSGDMTVSEISGITNMLYALYNAMATFGTPPPEQPAPDLPA